MNRRAWIVSPTSLSLATAAFAALGLGCSPAVDSGECAAGSPCPRGEECNLAEAICETLDLPTDSTESPAPATFSGKAVPFFRGEVCTVRETKAGESFPVFVNPCLHPCLDVGRFEFKHSWNCVGSSCDAWAAMWVTADSAANCPEDAFGQFDRAQCVYSTPVEFSISPVFDDGTAIQGSMQLEIPFFSNADMAEIAAADGSQAAIEARISQYPEDLGRVPSGEPISILDSHAAPPPSCGDDGSACDCFEIGF